MDISQITPKLYTGGAIKSRADVVTLKRLGISHVISCQLDIDDREFIDGSGIVFLDNGICDTPAPYPQPAEWFHRSIQFALEAAPTLTGLFVHCYAGHSRGPSTAYAILRAIGHPPALAERLIRNSRPSVGLEYIPAAEVALAGQQWEVTDTWRGEVSRMDLIQHLVSTALYGETERSEAVRHLNEDAGLYLPGEPRWICSILGAVHQELQQSRPDLAELVAEATWIAMRMSATIRDFNEKLGVA